jgi:hypothetical protein
MAKYASKIVIVFVAALLASVPSQAQQPGSVHKIGFVKVTGLQTAERSDAYSAPVGAEVSLHASRHRDAGHHLVAPDVPPRISR